MEPIRDSEDFKEAVRNVKNCEKGNNLVFQGDGSLDALFQGNVINLGCSWLLACHRTIWNHSETMRTLTKLSEMLETEENNQKDDFPRIQKSWCIYLALILMFWCPQCHVGPFWLFLTFLTAPFMSSMSLNGSIRYPDMWEVQNNLSLSHNLEKNESRLPSP